MDCIFCKINNKEIPSYTVYEDEKVRVMMDISPVTNGHMLIIPKEHYTNLTDIPVDTLGHIQCVAKNMHELLKEKLNIDGLTLCQNNDYGQEVKHYHLHLIPRYKNDNLRMSSNSKKDDIKDVYEKLTN